MTFQTPTEPPETPKAAPPRSMTAILWRVLAVAAVVGATVLVAHVLVRPGGRGSFVGGSAERPGEAELFAPVPAVSPREVPEAEWAEAQSDLTHVMAGILMAAAEEEGQYEDPANQTPQERRQFLAERFGLPADYPTSAAPADIVPDGADVLAVFDHPAREGTRMVLLALEQPVEDALAALRARYVSEGWTMRPMAEPRQQTERGWLVWFTRGRTHRVVFVRMADDGKETLAAVCDLGYE